MLDKAEIEKEVQRLEALQPWWHDIELPFGVLTCSRSTGNLQPNHNVIKWKKIKPYLNLAGGKIIDLGCNEGYYCIEALREGAARVVGVDINSHRLDKARFVVEVLGIDSIEYIQKSVYELTTEHLGENFDLALCLGLLHRVPDPFGIIQTAGKLSDTVIFEWVAVKTDEPIMKFWLRGHKSSDPHNSGFWKISRRCLKAMLWRNGFVTFFDIEPHINRAILIASKSTSPQPAGIRWQALEKAVTKDSSTGKEKRFKKLAKKVLPSGLRTALSKIKRILFHKKEN